MWVAHTFRTLRLTPFIYTQIVRAIVWVVTNYLSLPVSVCLLTCSVLRVEPWALCMLSMSPPWAPPQNPNRVIYVLCIPIRTFEWKTMNSKLSVQKWLANSQIFWLLENVTWFASRGTRWENKNTLTGGEYLPKRELNLSVCEHSLFSLCLAFISFSWIWHHGIFWRLSASVLGSIASWFFFFFFSVTWQVLHIHFIENWVGSPGVFDPFAYRLLFGEIDLALSLATRIVCLFQMTIETIWDLWPMIAI